MLKIKNLHATVQGKEILKGIDLEINAGEIHAIMGPNGSGKSTLSSVLVGHPSFEVTEGEVTFNGIDLLELEPEERAHLGLFLSFQYPVEIPGVSMVNFMRAAVNEHRKAIGAEPVSASDFLKMMREEACHCGAGQQIGQPFCERRLLRWRKKEERNIPNGYARTQAGYFGRNR